MKKNKNEIIAITAMILLVVTCLAMQTKEASYNDLLGITLFLISFILPTVIFVNTKKAYFTKKSILDLILFIVGSITLVYYPIVLFTLLTFS